MKTYVLFHGACQDGLGAKFAAWKKFGDKAIYIPVQYGKPLPEINRLKKVADFDEGEIYTPKEFNADGLPIMTLEMELEVRDVQVFIVDFSYPRDVLEALRSRVSKLVVLDHHKTAEEALRGFPGAHFDMNKSGAVLAWEYFHPGVPVPMILQHVQDRDLWRFKLPGTRELHASMLMIGDDMQVWDAMAEDSDMGRYLLTEAVKNGNSILRYEQKKIEDTLKNVKVLPYKGFKAGVLNTTTLGSEIGNAICKTKELGVDFALYYFFDIDGKPILSFRSEGDFDVSKLAKELGGGGHKNAAGAPASVEFIQQLYQGSL